MQNSLMRSSTDKKNAPPPLYFKPPLPPLEKVRGALAPPCVKKRVEAWLVGKTTTYLTSRHDRRMFLWQQSVMAMIPFWGLLLFSEIGSLFRFSSYGIVFKLPPGHRAVIMIGYTTVYCAMERDNNADSRTKIKHTLTLLSPHHFFLFGFKPRLFWNTPSMNTWRRITYSEVFIVKYHFIIL